MSALRGVALLGGKPGPTPAAPPEVLKHPALVDETVGGRPLRGPLGALRSEQFTFLCGALAYYRARLTF